MLRQCVPPNEPNDRVSERVSEMNVEGMSE